MAWAREHGVAPPTSLVAALRAPKVAKPACCSHCSAKEDCCAKKEPAKTVAASSPSLGWVSLMQAQRCRGGSSDWTGVPWGSFPPVPMTFAVDRRVETYVMTNVLLPASPAYDPALPPPRQS
jgi:hypothetical protein